MTELFFSLLLLPSLYWFISPSLCHISVPQTSPPPLSLFWLFGKSIRDVEGKKKKSLISFLFVSSMSITGAFNKLKNRVFIEFNFKSEDFHVDVDKGTIKLVKFSDWIWVVTKTPKSLNLILGLFYFDWGLVWGLHIL